MITMCEKEDYKTSCTNEPSSTDVICTEIYDPVCGCNDITYSNTCYAAANGVLTWEKGECFN